MTKLEGRIALITGSDSGMGRAMAEAFAAEDADVAVTYHSDQAGAQETRRIVEAAGRRAQVCRLDVRSAADVEQVFGAVQQTLGVPYILVNKAGVGAAAATSRRRRPMNSTVW